MSKLTESQKIIILLNGGLIPVGPRDGIQHNTGFRNETSGEVRAKSSRLFTDKTNEEPDGSAEPVHGVFYESEKPRKNLSGGDLENCLRTER